MKIDAFEATLTHARVGDTSVARWRVAELARHVDRAALLAADEAPEPPYWAHLWSGAVVLAAAGPPGAPSSPTRGASTRAPSTPSWTGPASPGERARSRCARRACRSPSSWSRSPAAARVRRRALRDLRRRDPHRQGVGQGGPASPRGDRRRGGLRADARPDRGAQPHRTGLLPARLPRACVDRHR